MSNITKTDFSTSNKSSDYSDDSDTTTNITRIPNNNNQRYDRYTYECIKHIICELATLLVAMCYFMVVILIYSLPPKNTHENSLHTTINQTKYI